MNRFRQCLEVVLKHEGGLSNRKADRGGLTNYGITQKTYSAWLKATGLPDRPVTEIRISEVGAVYQQYWIAAHCDYLPEPLDLVVFDSAVNHGAKRAVKLLQRVLGVDEDGVCGKITLKALHEDVVNYGIEEVCDKYLDARANFYEQIILADASQAVFAKGWMNRIDHLRELV